MESGIGSRVHVRLLIFLPVIRLKNLYVPCAFPVGPIAIAGVVRDRVSLDGIGSSSTSQYVPNGTRQCFSKVSFRRKISSLGEYRADIPDLDGKALSHITTKLISSINMSFGIF
jgi:hypothetical protein